jgi:thiamine biosynthesis protein ThiS
MKINFKTGGLLADILTPDSADEQMSLDVDNAATPVDVMKQLKLPTDDFYLVIVNDEVVPKSDRDRRQLKEGDELGIFPPLKGG